MSLSIFQDSFNIILFQQLTHDRSFIYEKYCVKKVSHANDIDPCRRYAHPKQTE